MCNPNLVLFYVNNPLESGVFYEKLFEQKPLAAFPTYVAFTFSNGFTFSLWSTQAKDFVSEGCGCRSELAFMVPTEDEVRSLYDRWKKLGVRLEQDLHEAVFGLTFVALDPDGHRVRVCMPDR